MRVEIAGGEVFLGGRNAGDKSFLERELLVGIKDGSTVR